MSVPQMKVRRSLAASTYLLCARLFLSCVLVTASGVEAEIGLVTSATVVADGRPWTMTMGDHGKKRKLTLLSDGTGRMEGGFMAMKATWRATADGVCLRPAVVTMSERCVRLVVRPGGYDAIENGKLRFELRR
jgi:hypothetical protein